MFPFSVSVFGLSVREHPPLPAHTSSVHARILLPGEFPQELSVSIPYLSVTVQSLGPSPVRNQVPLIPHPPTPECSSSLPPHEVGQGRESAPSCPDLIPCRLLNLLNCGYFYSVLKEKGGKKKGDLFPRVCHKVVAGGVRCLRAGGRRGRLGFED